MNRRLSEWYAFKPGAALTGHRPGIGLGRVGENTNMGRAFQNMKRSHIDWIVSFNPRGKFDPADDQFSVVKKSDEVWNEIIESGLQLGKWTSLHEVSYVTGDQRVIVGFDSKSGAIAFKMLWPELYIRPDL